MTRDDIDRVRLREVVRSANSNELKEMVAEMAVRIDYLEKNYQIQERNHIALLRLLRKRGIISEIEFLRTDGTVYLDGKNID